MKRKLLKYTQFVVIPALLVTTIAFVNSQQSRLLGKIDPKTPEGMRQATIQKKLNRRAAGYVKSDKPDEFEKFQLEIRSKIGEEKNSYEPGDVRRELEKATQNANKNVRSKQATWSGHGPGNLGGRTRAIVVDKSDSKNATWFAGSVGGGIWKTTNSGSSWTNVSGNISNLAISSIVQSSSNPDILYAGTGEGFGNVDAVYGNGVLKSTDHGATWSFLASTTVANTPNFEFVNRLAVDPSNADIVLATTNNGVYKSVNGGTSWTQKLAGDKMQQIVANSKNFMTQYVTENGIGANPSHIYKSIDGGENWSVVFTANASTTSLGRIELAVSKNDTNIVYAAIQDPNTGSITTDVYRSNDGGAVWNPSVGSADWLGSQGWYDNAIAIDPFDDNRVLAGGLDLYKLEFGSTSTQYISNMNLNTNLLTSNLGGSELGGMLLTASDWNPDIVATKKHIQVKFGAGFTQKAHRFTRSGNTATYKDLVDVPFEVWDVDAGTMLNISFRDYLNDGVWNPDNVSSFFDYVFISNSPYNPAGEPNMMVTGTYSSDEKNVVRAGMQYKLQNAFWVLTTHAFSVPEIEGSIIDISKPYTTYEREDTRISRWFASIGTADYVHADQHFINIIPTNNLLKSTLTIVGNDGGIFSSVEKDWKLWSDRYSGYVTTQFYGLDVSPDPAHVRVIGGLQDNGSWMSGNDPGATSSWTNATGGDGFDAVWNQGNANELVTSLYNGRLYLSYDGGSTFTASNSSSGPFITPVAGSTHDTDMLFTLDGSNVRRSDDFGRTWSLVASNVTANGSFQELKVSDADPQIVWVTGGGNSNPNGVVAVSNDGGLSFAPVTAPGGTGRFSFAISGFATHPTDKMTAYAIYSGKGSGKIYKTTNMGGSWTDISGWDGNPANSNGFPNVAVFDVQVVPDTTASPYPIYAATEIGVFVSEDDGATWTLETSLPSVSTWDLVIRKDRLFAATHGRGVWSAPLSNLKTTSPALAPRLEVSAGFADTRINMSFRSVYDSAKAVLTNNDEGMDSILYSGTGNIDSIFVFVPDSDFSATITIEGWKDGVKLIDKPFNGTLKAPADGLDNFSSDFDADYSASDWVLNGGANAFVVSTPPGTFSSKAAHSNPHPHPSNAQFILLLDKVIKVAPADSNTNVTFREVVILEETYDFAYVEGSTDGSNWTILAGPYDSSVYPNVNGGVSGLATASESQFNTRTIDLSATYAAGTNIKLRWRMTSDGGFNTYGWVIDDIFIQKEKPVVVTPDGPNPNFSFGLIQNPTYPSNAVLYVNADNEVYENAVSGSYNGTAVTFSEDSILGDLVWLNKTVELTNNSDVTVVVSGFGVNGDGESNGVAENDTMDVQLLLPVISTKSKSINTVNFTLAGTPDNKATLIGHLKSSHIAMIENASYTRLNAAIIGDAGKTSKEDFEITFKIDSRLISAAQVYFRTATGLEVVESKINGDNITVQDSRYGRYEVYALTGLVQDLTSIPTEFSLAQNYPNPFNPTTTIKYQLKENTSVQLLIFNTLGQKVKTLVNNFQLAGTQSAIWNGTNDQGRQVASGVYFYKLVTSQKVLTKKMILIK